MLVLLAPRLDSRGISIVDFSVFSFQFSVFSFQFSVFSFQFFDFQFFAFSFVDGLRHSLYGIFPYKNYKANRTNFQLIVCPVSQHPYCLSFHLYTVAVGI
ncbi:hypothetical protein CJ070_21005 [Salmonella enterica subsp. enterica serovar Montevideo]|uniref:Uncharacterized protein n=2 Tax=Salmonella enterica TaxID=28901 RepID=A0A603X8H6_SALET|nr:hypothetical protein [Salmonella enterica]EBH8483506.1 hypothetical protein [Salmonella enterica subsp. enterica serovar Braenderup]ECT9587528.1 hypothetical protein [Salmonella enterica subsp. enterica serovar Montevideo]EAM7526676.1 hypothetical protein [Salmonella enterica]EAN4167453.1 hypothetical protein [Salmonella enterica]